MLARGVPDLVPRTLPRPAPSPRDALGQKLFEAAPVKADEDLPADHNRRCGPALVHLHQFHQCLAVLRDVLFFERDVVGRKKLFRRAAGGSTGLCVDRDFFRAHSSPGPLKASAI